jgi:hypothetical protein
LGFKWIAGCGARRQRFLLVDRFAAAQSPTFGTNFKMRQFIIILLFLSPAYIWGQGFCKDSIIIYQNFENLRQNPYLDSIYVGLDSVTAYIDWQECPDYYFEKDSKKISLEDKLKELNAGNRDSFGG